MRASWLRCGFLLTFSAWGPGGPGAPALPGNPGGPWIDKEAGRNKSGAPSSFYLFVFLLSVWSSVATHKVCSLHLASRIYHGHLHCPATYTVLPSLDPPSRVHFHPGGTGQTCSSPWDHITGNFCVFTHRWAWKAWLALKSLGEEVRRSPLRLATWVGRGKGGAARRLCPHLP